MQLNYLNFGVPQFPNFSWMYSSQSEDRMVENEILLTTPDFSFDVLIERFEDSLLRYSVRRHGASDVDPSNRQFDFAAEAADYLDSRGCSCAHEMIRLGIEAME